MNKNEEWSFTDLPAGLSAEKAEKIRRRILERPHASNREVAKSMHRVLSGHVGWVRAQTFLNDVPDGLAKHPKSIDRLSGVALASRRVLPRRPAESAAKFIKRLPTGRGFSPRDLAQEWGMSEETIRRHARDMGCMKFVEVEEDEWHPLVMNPETAARYE